MPGPSEELVVRLAGSIVMSEKPGEELRLWRERLGLKMVQLAQEMSMSSSVLSDYERGRRKSPGAFFIRKYVEALLKLDQSNKNLLGAQAVMSSDEAILSMKEFDEPVPVRNLLRTVEAEVLAGQQRLDHFLYGYTVLDSIKAICQLNWFEFFKIFGASTERALIFTRVGLGRSPMVAVRVAPLKPRVVVIHGPENVDTLALQLAERDRIILAISRAPSVEKVVHGLSQLGRRFGLRQPEH